MFGDNVNINFKINYFMKNQFKIVIFFFFVIICISTFTSCSDAPEDEGIEETPFDRSTPNFLPYEPPPFDLDGFSGAHGKIRFNIKWNTIGDVDMAVDMPCGGHVSYSNRTVSCGGTTAKLDVDANHRRALTASPQENIYLTEMLDGNFKVTIDHKGKYHAGSGNRPFPGDKPDFTLTVFVGLEKKTFTGSVPYGGDDKIYTIKIKEGKFEESENQN